MGTMDMYDSPYFGSVGSGSIGRAMDEAYENTKVLHHNKIKISQQFLIN